MANLPQPDDVRLPGVPEDIPQKPKRRARQKASGKTHDNQPLIKFGDEVIQADLKGSPVVKKYREQHQQRLDERKREQMSHLAKAIK